MKIGLPIELQGPGGIRSWARTFSKCCLAKGWDVCYSDDIEVDVFIAMANLTALEVIEKKKRRGTKILYRMDGPFFEYFDHKTKHLKEANQVIKDCLESADKVIYQSRFSKYAASWLLEGKEIPGKIIYNGADNKLFRPEGKTLSKPENRKIVLSIAYWGTPLMAEYSVKVILDAAEKLLSESYIEFWILGEAYPETEDIIKKADLPNVTRYDLHSPIKYEDMNVFIRTADLILHTRPNDACSNLIIEAMNVGTPVVGLDSGSTPELIGNAGLLANCTSSFEKAPMVDVEDLAGKIVSTFHRYDMYKSKIMKRGRAFTQKIMCENYFELIKELLMEK